MPAARRRHDLGEHGARLRGSAGADQAQHRRALRPPFDRGDVRRAHAGGAAPQAEGAVPRRRASGGHHASRDGREDPVRQQLHDPLHQFPHRRERPLRAGLRARRRQSPRLSDRARGNPRISGPLALAAEQHGHLGQSLHPALRRHGLLARRPEDGARRHHRQPPNLTSRRACMQFLDDSLLPETQEKLVITAAPYGPEWEIDDFAEDLPLTMDEHVQKAVDCYNAGATVLHIHVRELDGTGSKRLSMFNELLRRLRETVPDMILQVGGSISFAPEGDGADAKWLSDDARHMLAELTPKPDQVTIAVNTTQMNIMDLIGQDDYRDTSLARPELYHAYREMVVPAGPEWVEEHIRRLVASGIQPHFQLTCMPDLETVERL